MYSDIIDYDPTVFAIPIFILLIALEAFIDSKQGYKVYNLKDSIACLSMGMGVLVIKLGTKFLYYSLLIWMYQFKLITIDNTLLYWIALVFLDDFCFYWFHRLSHTVRILWAAHVQHHSSEKMNLTVALRQSWGEPFYKFLFYLWLPLLGFHPISILIMEAISLIYQFFQHTQLIGKLGPLEWVFNTPSHHRVHHAIQIKYLDRNHAGIFIIWDRLFGTFEEEDLKEKPVYGITSNIKTFNPFKIATHEFIAIFKDIKTTNKFSDKLKYIFYPPGWSHNKPSQTSKTLRKQINL